MDAADCRLVAGVAEWLFGKVLLGTWSKTADHLAVCGRANGRGVMVDGLPWQTAGKSARYAGELVVHEPLDAVMRHLPF